MSWYEIASAMVLFAFVAWMVVGAMLVGLAAGIWIRNQYITMYQMSIAKNGTGIRQEDIDPFNGAGSSDAPPKIQELMRRAGISLDLGSDLKVQQSPASSHSEPLA
jgi:hypothetical protein